MSKLLFNPFYPDKMVKPDMFAGRGEELLAIEKFLFQTKNDNPQHFIVDGERGIGKSSVFLYVQSLARGVSTGIKYPKKFQFLCVSIDLGGCETEVDIIKRMASGLRSELRDAGDLAEKTKGVLDFLDGWEVLGVSYNKKETEFNEDNISREFVDHLNKLEKSGQYEGIIFLIDEADGPSVEANLGSYLKMTFERLERKGCTKVIFGLAGLPDLISKLWQSHESSPRNFLQMTLEPLEVEERIDVIKRAIDRANEINDLEITIEDDALEELSILSQGYPHFLQQFAYCAFDANTDNVIDVGDVIKGKDGPEGAIAQLGHKFFNELYNARIGSDDYRKVLDTLAEHGIDFVKRQDIITESSLHGSTVSNALKALKERGIIIQDTTKQGFYRLPNLPFSVWIKAYKGGPVSEDA